MQHVLGGDTRIVQLAGGIVRYLEEFGANGYFRGKHYVFDHRRVEDPQYARKKLVAEGTQRIEEEVLSKCFVCGTRWDDVEGQRRCSVATCNMPILVCRLCQSRGEDRKVTLLCELCGAVSAATQTG